MERNKILARVDLYGENDVVDFWEAFVFNLTHEQFYALLDNYEHDKSNNVREAWTNYLEKNDIQYEPLVFDIEQKLEW
ncbi:hypothetical protein [Niallia taxi]|uniref:hypothetical protein n=1 Tax=Niallia taxi TaxID=2499688 RepID=UPI0015F50468|nr:hypothetical protein [Niallia taxi]